MISSLSWIPRGVARSRPVRFELSAEEYDRIQGLALEESREQQLVDGAEEEGGDGMLHLGSDAVNDEQEEFMVRFKSSSTPLLLVTKRNFIYINVDDGAGEYGHSDGQGLGR